VSGPHIETALLISHGLFYVRPLEATTGMARVFFLMFLSEQYCSMAGMIWLGGSEIETREDPTRDKREN
jgi:hypothetical protein